MSMNIMHSNDNAPADLNKTRWDAITAIAEHGIVYISEATVNAIATLLVDAPLAAHDNHQTYIVNSYPSDGQEFSLPDYVEDFAPSLLTTKLSEEVRALVAGEGDQALAMFDLIVSMGLQISFAGKTHIDAHMTGINSDADDIEINLSSGNLYEMLRQLGLGDAINTGNEYGEVSFDRFAAAVNDNAHLTDMPHQLQDFVACAQRHQATTIHWG